MTNESACRLPLVWRRLPVGLLLVMLLLLGRALSTHFTNEWAVRIEGGPRVARLVAARMECDFRGPVSDEPQ